MSLANFIPVLMSDVKLRIPLDFDEAVKALLQTPPPPKPSTDSSDMPKRKAKVRKSKALKAK